MKRFFVTALLGSLLCCGLSAAGEVTFSSVGAPEAKTFYPFRNRPVEANVSYDSMLKVRIDSAVPGALLTGEIIQLDKNDRPIVRNAADQFMQGVTCAGMEKMFPIVFQTSAQTAKVRMELTAGGNPLRFTVLEWKLEKSRKKERFKGIYDAFDPQPREREKILESMKKIPPATAFVEKRGGRPTLIVDGKPMIMNAYKGEADFRIFGEAGGNLVITFNRGSRLYFSVDWDRALYNPQTDKFDFTRIEDNLIRIHAANPNARVLLDVGVDPDNAFLEKHPDNIFLNGKGERGRSYYTSFRGFGNQPLDKSSSMHRWAFSYTGKAYRERIVRGLRELGAFLRKSPAGNIVIGFVIGGGHDGQFVQWEYGDRNGHFDYSEANRIALCEYLAEIYGTDAALQDAWDDPKATLKTAANPTLEEYRKAKYFDDRPGLGRKIADCRRFIALGTARTLNLFASELKRALGRPAVVQTWYSTAIWAQPSRLALDELTKNEAVNIIAMVSYYAPSRAPGGTGASANSCIAAVNLRNLIYLQEMDHRTWRTERTSSYSMNAVAFPSGIEEFRSQIIRDGSSVLAAGGQGFYLYDMFGSWYHDPEIMKAVRTLFAMNRHVSENAGKYPAPKAAFFMDEATRLMSEYVPNHVNFIWRTSGITPALHFLSDLEKPGLPEYDLYLVWSPLTLTGKQLDALRKRCCRSGKTLMLIGDVARCSRDFSGPIDVLERLGLSVTEHNGVTTETVIPARGADSPILKDLTGCLESNGMYLSGGKLRRRAQFGFTVVDDPDAEVLGVWEKSGRPAFVSKPLPGGGKLLYAARNGMLTPALLHNIAKSAGVWTYSRPGNAVFVGNGVACVHRLDRPVEVDFGRMVSIVDPETGKICKQLRKWAPELKPGESAAICYTVEENEK